MQKARVVMPDEMTLQCQAIWIETIDGEVGYGYCIGSDTGMHFQMDDGGLDDFARCMYGRTWRAWDAKPTPVEQKGVAWLW